jgi:hypothetical protein
MHVNGLGTTGLERLLQRLQRKIASNPAVRRPRIEGLARLG